MKKTTIILIAILSILVSCQSERDKEVEALNKFGKNLIIKSTSKMLANGIIDSEKSSEIMQQYIDFTRDSTELGVIYAVQIWDIAQNQKSYSSTSEEENTVATETEKYFDLKIVNVWQNYGVGNLKFEIKNRLNKRIDDLYFEVSLVNSNGDYFGATESVRFNNIRPNGIGVADQGWIDTKINKVSKVIIVPERLIIEEQEYQFNSEYIKGLDNKYNIKIEL